MKLRIKRYNVVPIILFIYLGVMVYLGWPDYVAGATSPWLYFGGTAFTIFVIIMLRWNLKKRAEYRARRNADMENSSKNKVSKDESSDDKNQS